MSSVENRQFPFWRNYKVALFVIILSSSLFGEKHYTEQKGLYGDSTKSVKYTQNMNFNDSWVSEDKFHHFTASLLGTLFLSQACLAVVDNDSGDAYAVGSSTMFSVGVGKEFADAKQLNNHFCWKDLTANLFGAAFGIVLFLKLNGN